MKFGFIAKHRRIWPADWLCEALGVSRGGFYARLSRSGNVWDNAAMESFFSSLKTERTARKTYRTRDEGRADVFDYIEEGVSKNV